MSAEIRKILLIAAAGLVLAAGLIVLAANMIARSWARSEERAEALPPVEAKTMAAKTRQLESRMKSLLPRGTYLMIDTAENRLRVIRDGKELLLAIVSCGSGDILQDPSGERKWVFDTPRGEFTVSSKLVNPTWIKPDWAFYEEGEDLPKNFSDRIDNDTLGDYALGIGSGYFIHGTLYTRMLGRNVTHGCVRVGDEDLKKVYQTVPMGAKVYIY